MTAISRKILCFIYRFVQKVKKKYNLPYNHSLNLNLKLFLWVFSLHLKIVLILNKNKKKCLKNSYLILRSWTLNFVADHPRIWHHHQLQQLTVDSEFRLFQVLVESFQWNNQQCVLPHVSRSTKRHEQLLGSYGLYVHLLYFEH